MRKIEELMPVLALFLGLTAALALKPKDSLNFTYAVSGQTTNSWVILMNVTNDVEGEEYSCQPGGILPCTVMSNLVPSMSKISKAGSIILSYGIFIP